MNKKKIVGWLLASIAAMSVHAQSLAPLHKDTARANATVVSEAIIQNVKNKYVAKTDNGKMLIPVTRSQAVQLVTQMVAKAYAPAIEAARRDSVLVATKLSILKRKMLDDALRKYYMHDYDVRLAQLERLVLLSILQNGKMTPEVQQQLSTELLQRPTVKTRSYGIMPQNDMAEITPMSMAVSSNDAMDNGSLMNQSPIYVDEYGRRVNEAGQLLDANGYVINPQDTQAQPHVIVVDGGESAQWSPYASQNPQGNITLTENTPQKEESKAKNAAKEKTEKARPDSLASLSLPKTQLVGSRPKSVVARGIVVPATSLHQMPMVKTDTVRVESKPRVVTKYDTVYVNRTYTAPKVPQTSHVYFTIGKMHPNIEGMQTLNKVAQLMKQYPRMRVLLKGYSSAVGNMQFNNKLSQRRAQQCATYLLAQGVQATRIKVQAAGVDSMVPAKEAQRVDVVFMR